MSTLLRQVPGMPPPETLSSFLSGLKNAGCALLITGETDRKTRAAVSRRLFGVPEAQLETGEPPRKRMLIQTDQAPQAQQYLPPNVKSESTRCAVYDAAAGDRSTTTESPANDETDSLGRSQSTGLKKVAESVEQGVEEMLTNTGQPAPAELRIGCSSLRALEKRFKHGEIERFADSVATTARRHRGMCHLHYPMGDAAQPVRRLSTSVNARLDVSTVGSRIYVTWHTPYENVDGTEQPIDWFEMRDE